MPVIREYAAPDATGLRVSQTGAEATAAAARRVQGAYNEGAAALQAAGDATISEGRRIAGAITDVGEVVVKAIEHQEVSRGSKAFAEMQARATQAWNEQVKTADPNDPSVGPRFLQGLNKDLDEASRGFITEGGQRFAQGQVNAFRNHFTQKVQADQSAMAGHAIAVNLDQTRNALSMTARADPTSIDQNLSMYETSVSKLIETSPNLQPAQVARIRGELMQAGKEQIVKAGMVGLAEMSPAAAKKAIESGRYKDYISANDAAAILGNVKQQERAERADDARRRAEADRQREEVSDATENQYMKNIESDDVEVRASVTAKAIVNDDRLTRQAKARMIEWMEAANKPDPLTKISASRTTDLLTRMRSTDDAERIASTDPIYKAFTDKELTKGDFNFLIRQFNDMQTPDGRRLSLTKREFFRAVGPKIDKSNPLMGREDQDGKLNRYRLEQDVNKRIDEFRQAGKSPYLLFDPASPDYMGSDAAIAPYQKPLTDSMRDTIRRMRAPTTAAPPGTTPPPVPPTVTSGRKSGESPADYLKRIGRQ